MAYRNLDTDAQLLSPTLLSCSIVAGLVGNIMVPNTCAWYSKNAKRQRTEEDCKRRRDQAKKKIKWGRNEVVPYA